MRILVVGAGSTGGYFGCRLAQAGRDVTFLVRPKRAQQLQQNGLQIISPFGDVTLQPKLVTTGNLAGPFDAVLLTVKAFSLEAALDDLAPAIGPETIILPVLNGMKHDFSLRFLDEVTAVVHAVGKKPSEAFLTDTKAQLTAKGSTLTSSVYRDLQKGNPLEVDQIIGDLVVRAHRAQVPTPLLAAAFTHLSIYQKRIAKS
jgi:ketopantoate reductase